VAEHGLRARFDSPEVFNDHLIGFISILFMLLTYGINFPAECSSKRNHLRIRVERAVIQDVNLGDIPHMLKLGLRDVGENIGYVSRTKCFAH